MEKKTILFVLNKEATYLPPFLTILDSLCDQYSLKVISKEKEENLSHLFELYKDKDVTFISKERSDVSMELKARARRSIRKILLTNTPFYNETARLVNEEQYDLLWIIHEETIYEFRELLEGKKYLASLPN